MPQKCPFFGDFEHDGLGTSLALMEVEEAVSPWKSTGRHSVFWAVFGVSRLAAAPTGEPSQRGAAVQPAPMYATPAETAVTETENSIAAAPAAAVESAPTVPVEPAPTRAARALRPSAQPVRSAPPARSSSASPSYGGSASAQSPAPVQPSNTSVDSPVAPAIEPVENTAVERMPATPEPARRTFDELVIPADSVIGLQVETAVTSDRAKIEDKVNARVTRDVRVHDQVAIPAGARAEGSVTLVEHGGRLKDQARLGIRFHTIVLADGTRLPINTDTIYREGESPARESAAKIGGAAVGGAVLGAIFGGKKAR